MATNWTRTENALPPEGVTVETISPGGMSSRLRYGSGLWWMEDGEMYVYYVPEFWRYA